MMCSAKKRLYFLVMLCVFGHNICMSSAHGDYYFGKNIILTDQLVRLVQDLNSADMGMHTTPTTYLTLVSLQATHKNYTISQHVFTQLMAEMSACMQQRMRARTRILLDRVKITDGHAHNLMHHIQFLYSGSIVNEMFIMMATALESFDQPIAHQLQAHRSAYELANIWQVIDDIVDTIIDMLHEAEHTSEHQFAPDIFTQYRDLLPTVEYATDMVHAQLHTVRDQIFQLRTGLSRYHYLPYFFSDTTHKLYNSIKLLQEHITEIRNELSFYMQKKETQYVSPLTHMV